METSQENSIELSLKDQLLVSNTANKIARYLSRTSGIEAAPEMLMAEFIRLVSADEGAIQLLRLFGGTSRCTLVRGNEKDTGLLDKQLDDLMTGWILKENHPIISDVSSSNKCNSNL